MAIKTIRATTHTKNLEIIIVLEQDFPAEGYLEDEWCGRHVCVEEVAVAEPLRGKGIGERLVQVAVDYAKRNRLNVTTETHMKNRRGINFYKKLGLRPFSTKLILDLNRKLKL